MRRSRREFFRLAALGCGSALATTFQSRCTTQESFDFILRGGRILDGQGNAPLQADIGILGDRIRAIGNLEGSGRIIDAGRLYLAPGFIDVHAHTNLIRNPAAQSKVFQGVTLDITGPDGGSAFPERRDPGSDLVTSGDQVTGFEKWRQDHPAIAENVASYVGHSAVRSLVMGPDPAEPSATQLELMQQLVREAMQQGAVGLSAGLEYNPAGFAKTEEVIALAKVAAEFGGRYAPHMRSEDAQLVEAVEESIRISRESGAPLLITHLKVAGEPNWGKLDQVVEKIETARSQGLDVRVDRYPYLAYSTGLSFFYPGWSKEGGNFQQRLQDPATRQRMQPETETKVAANGGWHAVMISGVGEQQKDALGKRVDELAEAAGKSPYEFACDLLLASNSRISIVGYAMNEENTERILQLPYCMISSDGANLEARPGPGGHPRSFGTFPRAIRLYVKERKSIELPEMIRKMTSLPADTMRIRDRGRLQEGAFADIVAFDLEKLTDKATYLEPNQYSQGVEYLFVNGQPVIDEGKLTEIRNGRVLRRG